MLSEIRNNYLEILIIFFSSLLSFYFSTFGNVRIFDFVSFGLLFYLYNKNRKGINFDRNILAFFLFFSLFIILSIWVSIYHNAINLHLPRIIGTFYTIIYSILFYSSFKNEVDGLIVGVKYTIYIHVTFFYIQFISFFFLGSYIDFIQPITGNNSRNMGGSFNIDTSIRASGLYSEPASYSLFILTLMSIYILYKRKINAIDFIILFSVILSASASGVVYLFVFIGIYVFISSQLPFIKKIILGVLIITVFGIITNLDLVQSDYLINKVSNFRNEGSYQYRVGNTTDIFENLTDSQQLFGIGYANMDIKENKGSTYSALVIEHGLILSAFFMIIFLFLLLRNHVKWFIILYILVLFMGTHTYAQIQFWVWILSIIIVSNYLHKNERKIL